jgi:hypothetical protein
MRPADQCGRVYYRIVVVCIYNLNYVLSTINYILLIRLLNYKDI